jgi:hypothetical protein
LIEWRVNGCPYLPGRKLKCKRFRVYLEGQRGIRSVWFYPEASLLRVKALIQAGSLSKPQYWTSQGTEQKWNQAESFEENGELFLSHRLVLGRLDCSPTDLWRWRKVGCLYLGGQKLLVVRRKNPFGRWDGYYPKSQLDEILRNRATLPAKPPAGFVTPEEAARITGKSQRTVKRCFQPSHYLSKDRRGRARLKTMYRRDDLERAKRPPIAPARCTVSEASRSLGVSKVSLLDWCKNPCPYLKGKTLDYQTEPRERGGGMQFLLLRAEIEEIRALLRTAEPLPPEDGNGWFSLKAAARKLGVTVSILRGRCNKRGIKLRKVLTRTRWSHRGYNLFLSEADLSRIQGAASTGGTLPPDHSPGRESAPSSVAGADRTPAPAGQPKAGNGQAVGGRPMDSRTWEIYEFCYREYVTQGKGAPTVKSLANAKFGANTIREQSQVRLYARRYAKKYGLPRKQ